MIDFVSEKDLNLIQVHKEKSHC